ncbi:hypothetical protein QL285_026712 [Trifolium repens]|nr:hypothetical protein QL285_026712 [Trifolium repens]
MIVAVSSSCPASHVVVMGRFLPIPVVIVVVVGGYSLLYADVLARTLAKQLCLGRGRHVLGVSPLPFFPAKFAHLNLMGWIIGSFAYLGLFLYSWALP